MLVEWFASHERTRTPSKEFSALEETFGLARDVAHDPALVDLWGDADLRLYDSYVTGVVSTFIKHPAKRSSDYVPDLRLDAFLNACEGESSGNPEALRQIAACREYLTDIASGLSLLNAACESAPS